MALESGRGFQLKKKEKRRFLFFFLVVSFSLYVSVLFHLSGSAVRKRFPFFFLCNPDRTLFFFVLYFWLSFFFLSCVPTCKLISYPAFKKAEARFFFKAERSLLSDSLPLPFFFFYFSAVTTRADMRPAKKKKKPALLFFFLFSSYTVLQFVQRPALLSYRDNSTRFFFLCDVLYLFICIFYYCFTPCGFFLCAFFFFFLVAVSIFFVIVVVLRLFVFSF